VSFNRKQRDHQKVTNPVAKNDHNRGGFHEKSHKQHRGNLRADLSKIDLNDEQTWEQVQEELEQYAN
jgi:hypothetical protein